MTEPSVKGINKCCLPCAFQYAAMKIDAANLDELIFQSFFPLKKPFQKNDRIMKRPLQVPRHEFESRGKASKTRGPRVLFPSTCFAKK